MIQFTLPWPPSVNQLHAPFVNPKTGRPGIRLTSKAKRYKRLAAGHLMIQRLTLRKLTGDLRCTITARPPDNRRRDMSNLDKIVHDCITDAQVWIDDSQATDTRVVKGLPVKGGLLEITIEQLRS